MRLLVAIFIGAMLVPSAANAQDLLANCKTGNVSWTGPFQIGDSGFLREGVKYVCDDTQLYADEVTWDEKTLRAHGHLLLIQQGLRVTAERMEMDRNTRLGTFYKAVGTARLTDTKPAEKSMFGTLEPEISFNARELEKTGPRSYKLTDGWFSTCVQANPRWDIRGTSGTVALDEHVILRNALLRVKGIPVIYLPLMYYPLGKDDRSTGFLIPTYSTSTIRGQGISNAFFWAINRSQQATLYHDYFSKSGQGAGIDYEFVTGPGSRGELEFYTLDEKARFGDDGRVQRAANRSYEVKGKMNRSLGRYFSANANVRYYTDIQTQQLYQQNVYDASSRERHVTASLTGGKGRIRLFAQADVRDIYTDLTTAQRRGRLPSVSVSFAEKPIGRSRIYFGMNGEAAHIENQSDISNPATSRSVSRFDTNPTIRAPLSKLSFLSATATASGRLTFWTDSLDPLTGTPRPVSITRPLMEARVDMTGPVFSRIFQTPNNGYAERLKHVIEPRVGVQWLSRFDKFNEVIRNDSIDNIVGGNATVNYALFNRLYARRKQNGRVQEIVSVGVSQSYYTESTAGQYDTQYQNATAGRFSPIQISSSITPVDRVGGRLQMYMDYKTKAIESYSASLNTFFSTAQITAGWSKRQYLPNVPGFDNPAAATHYLNANASLRTHDGRFGGVYGFNLDVKRNAFLQQRLSLSYNAQCCGVSADYQIVDIAHLATGVKYDDWFNFSFTLAGIGSFSNPLGSFGR